LRSDRIGNLVHKLGIILTEQEKEHAILLPERKGNSFIRELAKSKKEEAFSIDPFVKDPDLWTRQDTTFMINSGDRGVMLRAFEYVRQFMQKLTARLAKAISENRELREQLKYLEKLGEPIDEAKEAVADHHHPQQLRLF
jgi:hypothetical protein